MFLSSHTILVRWTSGVWEVCGQLLWL
uniref:Uncharacterized protein n=1 Tax=Arundo donax TaxID=35708 RepID=A0A0A9DW70_ARUDO